MLTLTLTQDGSRTSHPGLPPPVPTRSLRPAVAVAVAVPNGRVPAGRFLPSPSSHCSPWLRSED